MAAIPVDLAEHMERMLDQLEQLKASLEATVECIKTQEQAEAVVDAKQELKH